MNNLRSYRYHSLYQKLKIKSNNELLFITFPAVFAMNAKHCIDKTLRIRPPALLSHSTHLLKAAKIQ